MKNASPEVDAYIAKSAEFALQAAHGKISSENAKITEIFCWNLRCWLDGRLDAMRNVFDKRALY